MKPRTLYTLLILASLVCLVNVVTLLAAPPAIPTNTQNALGINLPYVISQGYSIGADEVISSLRAITCTTLDTPFLNGYNTTVTFGYEPASYIVWRDGSTYYAKNGVTGQTTTGTVFRTLINSIIAALTNGGSIFIKSGTYVLTQVGGASDGVTINQANIDITGEGASTIFYVANSSPINAITVTADNASIRNLKINGNKANNINTAGFVQNGVLVDNSSYCTIQNIYAINNEHTGILLCNTSNYNYITSCYLFYNDLHGFNAQNECDYNIIKGCTVVGNVEENLHDCESDYNSYVDNVCEGSKYGIHINNCIQTVITGNNVKSASIRGILADANCNGTTITGNVVTLSGQTGIVLDGSKSRSNTITGNTCNSNGNHGIHLNSGPQATVVSSNTAWENSYYGILLDASSYNIIQNNLIVNNSQIALGSHAGIVVNGDCNYNQIQQNKVYGLSHSYGILLTAATDENLITENDLYNAGTVGKISVAGTNNRIYRNRGFVTENIGTGTINNGATTATINHGLSYTPSAGDISITFTEDPTNDITMYWITGISSTQFTLNVNVDPGATNLDFTWSVIRH